MYVCIYVSERYGEELAEIIQNEDIGACTIRHYNLETGYSLPGWSPHCADLAAAADDGEDEEGGGAMDGMALQSSLGEYVQVTEAASSTATTIHIRSVPIQSVT